jgi:ribosomal protein RSM22 (predicted rRNA methylase)
MSGDFDRDLDNWMPRLLSVWRKARRKDGPRDALTPQEVKDVARGVKTLSMGLTRDRALAGQKYMDDPVLLGAYLLFYWPVSYAQARRVLGELDRRPRSVLDLGSGPGPVGFAALDAGAKDVTCADRSKAALQLASQLAIEAAEGLPTREWSPERPLPDGTWDVITMGHVVNELFGPPSAPVMQKRAALLEQIAARVTKGGSLVVMEPALRETSRALLQVRDLLVAKGYAVRAPCLYRGNCPALVKETDWCHAERQWRAPRVVEEIARAAGLHKEALKMSYLVLAPPGEAWAEPPAGRVFRIVSEPLQGKGRARYMGCGPEGRVGLALQEKHRAEKNEAFFSLQRGDVIRVGATEEKGDGFAIGEGSEVEVVARAGRSVPQGGGGPR